MLSELFCGILLGFVFIQSHNGMEVYNDGRDFVSSQLASTRNVHGNLFNDWCVNSLVPFNVQHVTLSTVAGLLAA